MRNLVLAGLLLLVPFSVANAESETVEIKLVIENHKFSPEEIKAPAGKRVELVVENKGPGAEEFESHDLKREKVIPMGQTAKIKVGPLKKGTYKFFGEFHQETAKGQLVIE